MPCRLHTLVYASIYRVSFTLRLAYGNKTARLDGSFVRTLSTFIGVSPFAYPEEESERHFLYLFSSRKRRISLRVVSLRSEQLRCPPEMLRISAACLKCSKLDNR